MAIMCQGCGVQLETWTGSCPECGGTAPVELKRRKDPMLERLVGGRYKVVKKLGQGGMGSVYLAEHTGVGQRVAIKFLNPSFSGDADVVRRFLNEARSYGQITHPHAVQLHDFGQDEEGNLFISMEYIEGQDLKRTLEAEKRLRLKDAIDIALQVCDVLRYAHTKGIVHRDLKPENIMLVKGLRGYHAKVLDFGVARLMAEQGTRLTAAGAICGTPRYMSPEQAEGGDVDHRTDIYALGLVLFECLTGVHPFTAGSIAETLRKQVMEPMPHLAEVAPDLRLPEALDAAIQKAVAKVREQRFGSMEELGQALVEAMPTTTMEALEGEPVDALGKAKTLLRAPALEKTSHEGSPYARDAAGRKARGLAIALGAAGLLLAGGGVWLALRPTAPARPAEWDALEKAQAAQDAKPPAAAKAEPQGGVVDAPEPGAHAGAGGAAVVPASAGAGSQPATGSEAASVRLLAENAMYAQAHNEFLAGRLDTSGQMLDSIPADSAVADKVKALRVDIAELTALMRRADGLYRQGRCGEAIGVYQQVRKRNAGIRGAADGIARCRREMPAGTID